MNDVQRFKIPTPFDVGPVNCYVFEGEELTLLDPGPATEEAYEALTEGLNDDGFGLHDVGKILVTHPHLDHFGLAHRLAEESGARVVAHRDATEQLGDPDAHLDREQAFFSPFLQAMGVPEDIVETVVSLPDPYTDFREPVDVDRELTDGDVVDVGVETTAVHTPGHAPGSVCFVPRTEPVAFTGDHVLEHISPNPLLTLVPGSNDERTRSLPTYLESLRTLAETHAEVGYSGHGELVSDLPSRIDEVIAHHRDRKERIADMVAEMGPVTAYRIMQEMFPNLPVTEMFPGMSEVIGHLDLLENEGRVDITESEGLRRYSLSLRE